MDAKIKAVLDGIIKAEGGYVNHPNDRGGPTKFGITQATLSQWRGKKASADDVKNLTETEARDIYYAKYVRAPSFDQIFALDPKVGYELIDAGVLSGPTVPSRWLQRVLNVMNNQGKLYPDLKVDGAIGQKTIDTYRNYLKARGRDASVVMHRALNCLQGEYMISISENRQANESFTYGWLANRVD